MLTHRCNRFMVLLTGLRHYTTEQLLAVMQDRRYQTLLRAAALRWLINSPPLDITKRPPYLQRRRYVRQHYGV